MVSSKNFAINDGSNAGVYCSYCGEKISPQKDIDGDGGFYSQCICADAKAEIILLTQKQELLAKIEKFYSQRDKQTKRIQLLAHRSNIELQLQELTAALAELNDDEAPKKELSSNSSNSLKMEKPKLPSFNQGTP